MLAALAEAPATAPVKQVDLNEAGRVLATLNDWRALMFTELIIIGVLVLALLTVVGLFIWAAGKRSANDQATLQALTENTKASADNAASLRAAETVLARIEADLAHALSGRSA